MDCFWVWTQSVPLSPYLLISGSGRFIMVLTLAQRHSYQQIRIYLPRKMNIRNPSRLPISASFCGLRIPSLLVFSSGCSSVIGKTNSDIPILERAGWGGNACVLWLTFRSSEERILESPPVWVRGSVSKSPKEKEKVCPQGLTLPGVNNRSLQFIHWNRSFKSRITQPHDDIMPNTHKSNSIYVSVDFVKCNSRRAKVFAQSVITETGASLLFREKLHVIKNDLLWNSIKVRISNLKRFSAFTKFSLNSKPNTHSLFAKQILNI